MTVQVMQTLDAAFLIGMVICMIVVLQRDYKHAHIIIRIATIVFMIFAYGQAMWLLGVWVPGASGFPLPRLGVDGSLFVLSALRTAFPGWLGSVDSRAMSQTARGNAREVVMTEKRHAAQHSRTRAF